MSRDASCTEFLRYDFTVAELEELSQKLARALVGIEEVEVRRAEANAKFKEELETLHIAAGKLAHQVRDRSEMRWVPCRILWNSPNDGQKTIVRAETGEWVKQYEMTEGERQEELPLAELTVEPIADESTGKDAATN